MSEQLPAFMRESRLKRVRNRLFHLLFVLRRPMTLGVRGVVFDEERTSVFLIRHTYVPGWQFPGGGVERGETTLEALARELQEEGNIELTAAPTLRSIHFNSMASPRDHVVLFMITGFRQTAPKTADIEIAEAGFFPLDALPKETTPATRRRIAELFGEAEASPLW